MGEKDVLTVVGLVIAALVFVALAFESGVLPWAILLGLVTSAAALLGVRQWKPACAAGGGVAVVVSVFGIWAMVSPGWYQGLL